MPSDKLVVRINGNWVTDANYVELLSFEVGYFGISRARLLDRSRRHDTLRPRLQMNDLIEVARDDGFNRLVWKGRVTRVLPGGMTSEGIEWEARGLEYLAGRRVHRWNLKSRYHYNENMQTDTRAPGYSNGSSIDITARWTAGEILVDILEHAFGINNPVRQGIGLANMPTVSAIPWHHTHQTSVNHPYMTDLMSQWKTRDYLEQLTWDPSAIMSLLNFTAPDTPVNQEDFWSLVERIVSLGGEHGVYIDPSIPTQPWLIVHQFTNSTMVSVSAGLPDTHAETPSYRVIDDKWEFDESGVRNLVVLEGAPQIEVTNATTGALDDLWGGKVWRLRDSHIAPVIPGVPLSDPDHDHRTLSVNQQADYGPVLYEGSQPVKKTDSGQDLKAVVLLDHGLVLLPYSLSGKNLWLRTFYEVPYQVSVGPAAGQWSVQPPATASSYAPRYPTPTGWDAFAQFGIVREWHIYSDSFASPRRWRRSRYMAAKTQPELTAGRYDGHFEVGLFDETSLTLDGYPAPATATAGGSASQMLKLAEELQRRFRDVRIRLTVTLDQILLADLYAGTGQAYPGLRTQVNVLNLQHSTWTTTYLQVMRCAVDVRRDRVTLDLTNDIFGAAGRVPAIVERMNTNRLLAAQIQELRRLLKLDSPGLKTGDGEVSSIGQGARFDRYPGNRAGFTVHADYTGV